MKRYKDPLYNLSWLPITRTLANSNQNRFPLDLRHTFTVSLPSVTRTLANSKLPLTRSSFCFPSDHFYIILPSITRMMFWALKSQEKNSLLASQTLNFEFPIDVLYAYSLLFRGGWCSSHKSNVKQLYFSKPWVKRMLYLSKVLLCYVQFII